MTTESKLHSGNRPNLGAIIGMVLLTTLVCLGAIFYGLAWLTVGAFDFWADVKAHSRLDPGQLFDISRASVTMGAALAIGATLVLAFRRQKTNEETLDHEKLKLSGEVAKEDSRIREHEAEAKVAQEIELRSRFGSATTALGANAPASRLAGVLAIASLADEWHLFQRDDERQACVDILCAYMRLPIPVSADSAVTGGEFEVRKSIMRVIAQHLRNTVGDSRWDGCEFNFEGATITYADFSGCELRSGSLMFDRTHVVGTMNFDKVVLRGGRLSFRGATIDTPLVSFINAKFIGSDVRMSFASIRCRAFNFYASKFLGGAFLFECEDVTDTTLVFDGTHVGAKAVKFVLRLRDHSLLSFKGAKFFEKGRLSVRLRLHEGTKARFNGSIISEDAEIVLERTLTLYPDSVVEFNRLKLEGGSLRVHSPQFLGGKLTFENPPTPHDGDILIGSNQYLGDPVTIRK